MLIKSIRLQNFLSFDESAPAIDLGPLNIIIGPNGSGKSNFLEAFEILRNAPGDIFKPIKENGGFNNWFNKKDNYLVNDTSIEIGYTLTMTPDWDPTHSAAIGPDDINHFICLGYDNALKQLSIDDEAITESFLESNTLERVDHFIFQDADLSDIQHLYRFDGMEANIYTDGSRHIIKGIIANKSILAQFRDPNNYPEITYLSEILTKIVLYREWSFGRLTKPRLPQAADLPNDFLLPDSSNLGLILNRIRRESTAKKRFLEALRQLYEGIEDYDVQIEGGTVQVFFQEKNQMIPATRLSDGTLRYLSLLAILVHPAPPPLICLEEPELGLHPDILPTVAELLKEASSRTQLIVTTHSDILVDSFSDQPEAILVCEKKSEGTTLRRLDPEQLKPWLEKYRLGELWTRGDIGGVRW